MSEREEPTGSLPGEPSPGPTLPELGETIGPYHLLGVLGTGGFGVVYEAEQSQPVRRRVALKVIKPGMDSATVVARFEAERQALAVMDHPCIAKVFDGGMTDPAQGSRPYFVMELVRGDPITEFCDKNRLNIRERCALMIRVCEAVQHAHAKGVVHRDIKPSNILVRYGADGHAEPKVIDFGVAKALNQRLSEQTIFTDRGQVIGTPEYMSPEQAEMSGVDIDTRSDVYSLGVVLYELLTGALPFSREEIRSAALAEMARIIREVEPPRPSTRLSTAASKDAESAQKIVNARRSELRTIAGELRRDLDWVVMKCLEKERERRYSTATALGEDLEHFLRDEPVEAGPPSLGYQGAKFIRRHRISVALGLSIAMLGAVSGSMMLWSLAQADRAREDRDALRTILAYERRELSDPLRVNRVDAVLDLTWSVFGETPDGADVASEYVSWFADHSQPIHRRWTDPERAARAESALNNIIRVVEAVDDPGGDSVKYLAKGELWQIYAQTGRLRDARAVAQDERVEAALVGMIGASGTAQDWPLEAFTPKLSKRLGLTR